MEIWLDTINFEMIERGQATGLITGVTTNPSLISASSYPLKELINYLLKLQTGFLALQVISEEASEMIKEAQKLFEISPRIVVKVPANEAGFQCMQGLRDLKIPYLATALFTPLQALLGMKLGATYLAPYVGRIQDQGMDPWQMLTSCLKAKERYGYPAKIMAAGLRTITDLENCLEIGVQTVTLRDSLFSAMLQEHPGVTQALQKFKTDWNQYAFRK